MQNITHEYSKEMECVVKNYCALFLSLPLIFMTVQSFVYTCILESEKERESLERGERYALVHTHVFKHKRRQGSPQPRVSGW